MDSFGWIDNSYIGRKWGSGRLILEVGLKHAISRLVTPREAPAEGGVLKRHWWRYLQPRGLPPGRGIFLFLGYVPTPRIEAAGPEIAVGQLHQRIMLP